MCSDVTLRRMTLADLEPVVAIEEATFPHPWTRQDYTDELTRNKAARYLVAEVSPEAGAPATIAGFAGAWIILDESHITNIAVAERFRRRGIGRQVTLALLQYLSNLGAAYATLEVRESNLPAQSLYKSLGFIAVAEGFRRRGIGRKVTEALLQYLSNLGAAYATLEVRESNLPAQSLYKSLGFLAVGRRKRYYEDNGEDALLMVCDRMPPADPEFVEPETVFEG